MKYHALMILRRALCALSGYRVYAMDSTGTRGMHAATCRADALEWMRCYPADCAVYVHHFARLVCVREVVS